MRALLLPRVVPALQLSGLFGRFDGAAVNDHAGRNPILDNDAADWCRITNGVSASVGQRLGKSGGALLRHLELDRVRQHFRQIGPHVRLAGEFHVAHCHLQISPQRGLEIFGRA